MAKLVYSAITSLDGYVVDADDNFDWAAPDEEVHAFVNDQERLIGTYLYGRRLYEVMAVWQTMDTGPDQNAVMRDYAELWREAEKVVYSTTLERVDTPRTTLERSFDADAVGRMVAASVRDVSVGGPTLAAEALRTGLVDELHQFLNPIVVGGGTPWLPRQARLPLELIEQRRFTNGVVHLHYGVR